MRAIICIIAGVIAGCKVGPDYRRPSLPVPGQYKEENREWVMAHPRDTENRGTWWTVFHDAELNKLESQLNISDQNIIVARANYEQARALVDEARAAYFPTLSATGALTYQNTGNNTTNDGTIISGSSTGTNIAHQLGLNASWEPDFFGAIGRNVEASRAAAESLLAQVAATQLSEQASLAQFYFELRGVDSDQILLDKLVVADKRILTSTREKYHEGTASMVDVLSAKKILENAQSAATNNRVNRALFEHAIAILIGKSPAELSLSPNPFFGKPPRVAPGFPSQLLERRPDVAAAERTVAQANAQIGVAKAAYFPVTTLSASAAIADTGWGHWLSWPLLSWSVGPTLAETILDGGLRSATVAAAKANYRSTVATYRQTVLVAFQNVEDNLAALRILERQAETANAAAQDADLSLQLIINQFNAGTAAYPDIDTARVAAFTAEKNAVDVTTLRMTYTVALVKALGGVAS